MANATLAIRIVSDARGAAQGFQEAESRVDGFQRGLDRASVGAGVALAGIGALATGAFNAASAFQQSSGAIESVFGSTADFIAQKAQSSAQDVGLSANSYQELASTMGAQLKNMGISMEELGPQTDQLITMGADLAATYGGTTADAVAALSSLLRGETDPIERYGISIKQSGIDAQVAAMGMDGLEGAAGNAARTQAIMSLLTTQAGGALGAFSREADTAAGQTQRAGASWEDAQAQLGAVLLPVVSAAAEKFASLSQFLMEHKDVVLIVVGVVAGLAAAVIAVNAAMAVYQAITTVVTAVQWLFNTALLANPLTWIVLLIIAVVAAVVIMYQKFDWFRNFVQGYFSVVTFPLRTMFDIIGWIWDKVGGLGGIFSTAFNIIKGALDIVTAPIRWLVDKLGTIGDLASGLGGVIGSVVGFFSAPGPAPAGGGGGPVSGMYGAAAGSPGGLAPIRGASLTAGAGGGSATGSGPLVVNVTVNGALDPVAVGRQVYDALREFGAATGRQVSMAVGR